MSEIVICAIIKNEGLYVYEWLSYHAYLGVKHFYIYENGSSDNTREVLASWPDQTMLTVVDWPGSKVQVSAYQHMIENHKHLAEWCAFIDCDEFLAPQNGGALAEVLDSFSARCDALFVHWLIFGSSGQKEYVDGFVTDRFVARAQSSFGPNSVGKTIVRLNKATTVRSCHVIRCEGVMMTDDGEVVDQSFAGIHSKASHSRLAVNHYFTKSLGEWIQRRSRGRADRVPQDPDYRRTLEEFHRHDQNAVIDKTACGIAAAARKMYPPSAVGSDRAPSAAHEELTIDFARNGNSQAYATDGWSLPEPNGRWCVKEKSEVTLAGIERGAAYDIEISLHPYVPEGHGGGQRLTVFSKGTPLFEAVSTQRETLKFHAPAAATAGDTDFKLTFRTPDAASPARLGLSNDARDLAFFFTRLVARKSANETARPLRSPAVVRTTKAESAPEANPQSPARTSRLAKQAVAAVTMVYNEPEFLPLWVRHYAKQCGLSNLFVIDHGSSHKMEILEGVNVIRIPRTPYDPIKQSEFLSRFCSSLLFWYGHVLYCDVDEFVVPDPRVASSLSTYVARNLPEVLNVIGLNILHRIDEEPDFDFSRPVFEQRRYGFASSSMCKPLLFCRDIQWCGGSHSADARVAFDHLYMFHLRWIDLKYGLSRLEKTRSMAWAHTISGGHARVSAEEFKREMQQFGSLPRLDGEDFSPTMEPVFGFLARVIESQNGREYDACKIDLNMFGQALWRVPDRFLGCL